MLGRPLRVIGTVLVIAVAFVTPVLATSAASASANAVVNGCTIVSNPTSTNFTNCPGADLSGANLSGVDLSFANLAGAQFITCTDPSVHPCPAADLTGANFTNANLNHVSFVVCPSFLPGVIDSCNDAPLSGANFTNANLFGASFADCPPTGFDLSVNGTCVETPLEGVVFARANLSNTFLAGCSANDFGVPLCGAASLSGDDLTGANLAGATLGACLVGFGDGAGLKICAGSDLNSANLTGATLTGANLTATSLVPSNQTVTATSPAGAVVTWPTAPSLPGATPGSCTPSSGSTFPIGGGAFTISATTVTCQVLDGQGDVATGTFTVSVLQPPLPTTFVGIPSGGASVSGDSWLDAGASSPVGVAHVSFELSGGTLNHQVISGSTPTFYGWIGAWNSTRVPNGTYSVQSVVTDDEGFSATSARVTITVNNPAPTTSVLVPSDGATQSGMAAVVDASASGASGVSFELSGGTITNRVIATGKLTLFGWIGEWDTTSVPDGTYTLQSVVTYSGGIVTSAPITINVSN